MSKMSIKLHEAVNKDGLDIDSLKKDINDYVSGDDFQGRIDNIVIQLANTVVNEVLEKAGKFDSNQYRPSEDSLVDAAYARILDAMSRYVKNDLYH